MSAAAVVLPVGGADAPVPLLDPSELYRPEHKKMEDFRIFNEDKEDPIQARIYQTYLSSHTYQTVDFVRQKMSCWTQFNKARMTIMDALQMLNRLVDDSDPDIDIPNIVHAFQTAEGIREAHPDLDWFHLTGLVHDLGKIMALYDEPQWCVVGDTFPVGCAVGNSVVHASSTFHENVDMADAKYNTRLGMYEENCGLKNVLMSWGHDEYMYQVLRHHGSTLPEEAYYIIRFHSFYPWHTGNNYEYLTNEEDRNMLKWVREFNKFDLYTKCPVEPDIEALTPYYQSLIDKYIPGIVEW